MLHRLHKGSQATTYRWNDCGKFFPTQEYKNMCIAVSGIGSGKDFSTLIVNQVPCLDMVEKAQCFPLYYYEENKGNIGTLFDRGKENYIRRDGITDFILEQCRTRYGHKVVKEDIFYYVYGLLHSKDYREQFAADLKKMLPRISSFVIRNFSLYCFNCFLKLFNLLFSIISP